MGALTGQQQVARRGKSERRKAAFSGASNKSAGSTSGFMSQFSQKPVRIKSKKSESMLKFAAKPKKASQRLFSGTFSSSVPKGLKSSSVPRSGFSFPLPSAATIAVIAGTVIIALTALNWEDFEIKLPESFVFQPIVAEDSENRAIQYAAIGIPMLPAAGTVPTASSVPTSSVPEAASSVPTTSSVPTASSVPNSSVSNASSVPTAASSVPTAASSVPTSSVPTASSVPTVPEAEQEKLLTFEWQQYKVKKGDSVSGIAKKFDVSIGAIIASNEIKNAKTLQEGALLRIPNIDGIPYAVKKGDNLTKISAAFNVPLEVILDINDIKSDKIRVGETLFIPGARMNDIDLRMSLGDLFIYPVQSKYITSKFGMRKDPISGALNFHTGIDLRGNTGAPVTAAMEGTISVVGENWLYGKHIIMSHSNGYKTLYGHLNAATVKQGEKIARGKKIGEVGNTGYSTGSHLHFSIYDKNGKLVNPLDLLN